MNRNDIRDLYIHAFKGTSPDVTKFSSNDIKETLRAELSALAPNKYEYERNKQTIFQIIQEAFDEVIPAYVGSFIGQFAEVKQVPNGQKARFKVKRGRRRAKTFVTEVLTLISEEEGFPRLKGAFKYNKNEVIIETLLGPSLDKIIHFYNKPFTVPTICLIGIEIIKRLESLHKLGILHNDLKPSNFSWGIFKEGEIKNKNETPK